MKGWPNNPPAEPYVHLTTISCHSTILFPNPREFLPEEVNNPSIMILKSGSTQKSIDIGKQLLKISQIVWDMLWFISRYA